MSTEYSLQKVVAAAAAACELLTSRKEEINRLNVFPVPDGDTGTNMSLTLQSVVDHVVALGWGATEAEYRKAVVSGALMGARGNSGVITSQILRGLIEGSEGYKSLDTECLAAAFKRAVEVAFQAVRKPVQGTILTVLQDSAEEAIKAHEAGLPINSAFDAIVQEAFASVERTPDFLPVLKENNVVDAGGFGLAILFEGFSSFLQGKTPVDMAKLAFSASAPKVEIEQINDWEGSEYRYCNEFLVDSDSLDTEAALEFLSTMGDCELCVGSAPKFKVHVHSNNPDQVLKYFLDRGQVSEVFIHNMDLQSQERVQKIADKADGVQNENAGASDNAGSLSDMQQKTLGFVAVAVGAGNAEILRSLGVDVVVEGGQTMNPSTKDLLEAIESVPANAVIVLPDNSNIILAASSACDLSTKECAVVPTRSLPEGIAAMFASDVDASVQDNVSAMEKAIASVKTGEVTVAIKESKDRHGNKISDGDVIGITGGEIEKVGDDVANVVLELLLAMQAEDGDTLTLLGGQDFSADELVALSEKIEEKFPNLEVDAHDGGQPLYPVIFSVE